MINVLFLKFVRWRFDVFTISGIFNSFLKANIWAYFTQMCLTLMLRATMLLRKT